MVGAKPFQHRFPARHRLAAAPREANQVPDAQAEPNGHALLQVGWHRHLAFRGPGEAPGLHGAVEHVPLRHQP